MEIFLENRDNTVETRERGPEISSIFHLSGSSRNGGKQNYYTQTHVLFFYSWKYHEHQENRKYMVNCVRENMALASPRDVVALQHVLLHQQQQQHQQQHNQHQHQNEHQQHHDSYQGVVRSDGKQVLASDNLEILLGKNLPMPNSETLHWV